MNNPLKVGLTGGIGSGKTLVTKLFSILNVPIYYADERAKELMNSQLVGAIKEQFGSASFINGELNRAFLATKVFSNKLELDKLNAIVHPAVASDFEEWVQDQKKAKYVIKEAALLVEAGSYKQLDNLIVITSPKKLRIERIKVRDPFRTELEISNIIDKQASDEAKIALADFIIPNDEESLLVPQVIEIDKKIRQY
jgi:dephospho-CoA kinase